LVAKTSLIDRWIMGQAFLLADVVERLGTITRAPTL
jgi:hypothetical protein